MGIRRDLVDLTSLDERLTEARREQAFIGERLDEAERNADEARLRKIRSETPLADRIFERARDDLNRVRRRYDRIKAIVAELAQEQERLFARLTDRSN